MGRRTRHKNNRKRVTRKRYSKKRAYKRKVSKKKHKNAMKRRSIMKGGTGGTPFGLPLPTLQPQARYYCMWHHFCVPPLPGVPEVCPPCSNYYWSVNSLASATSPYQNNTWYKPTVAAGLITTGSPVPGDSIIAGQVKDYPVPADETEEEYEAIADRVAPDWLRADLNHQTPRLPSNMKETLGKMPSAAATWEEQGAQDVAKRLLGRRAVLQAAENHPSLSAHAAKLGPLAPLRWYDRGSTVNYWDYDKSRRYFWSNESQQWEQDPVLTLQEFDALPPATLQHVTRRTGFPGLLKTFPDPPPSTLAERGLDAAGGILRNKLYICPAHLVDFSDLVRRSHQQQDAKWKADAAAEEKARAEAEAKQKEKFEEEARAAGLGIGVTIAYPDWRTEGSDKSRTRPAPRARTRERLELISECEVIGVSKGGQVAVRWSDGEQFYLKGTINHVADNAKRMKAQKEEFEKALAAAGLEVGAKVYDPELAKKRGGFKVVEVVGCDEKGGVVVKDPKAKPRGRYKFTDLPIAEVATTSTTLKEAFREKHAKAWALAKDKCKIIEEAKAATEARQQSVGRSQAEARDPGSPEYRVGAPHVNPSHPVAQALYRVIAGKLANGEQLTPEQIAVAPKLGISVPADGGGAPAHAAAAMAEEDAINDIYNV